MSIFGDFKYSRQWMMQLSLFGPFPPQEPECVLVCRKILILSLTQPNGILVLGVERVQIMAFYELRGAQNWKEKHKHNMYTSTTNSSLIWPSNIMSCLRYTQQ